MLGRALKAEEIQYLSVTARRIAAILLLGNRDEPTPTATEDPIPSKDAQLKGEDIAVQECEPEKMEVKPCFDK